MESQSTNSCCTALFSVQMFEPLSRLASLQSVISQQVFSFSCHIGLGLVIYYLYCHFSLYQFTIQLFPPLMVNFNVQRLTVQLAASTK